MAKIKRISDQKYMEQELAESQRDPHYEAPDNLPAEQYSSPEPMRKHPFDHKGKKSITLGYKG